MWYVGAGEAWRGTARLGMAGRARFVTARRGAVCPGSARQARSVTVRWGRARCGLAGKASSGGLGTVYLLGIDYNKASKEGRVVFDRAGISDYLLEP